VAIDGEDPIGQEDEDSNGNSVRPLDDRDPFVTVGCKCDIFLDSPAVLETEARIICSVTIALKSRSRVIMRCESSI
jgi:hypothetical protein